MKQVPSRLMLERVVIGPAGDDHEPVLALHDGERRPDHLTDLAAALPDRQFIAPRASRWASLRGPGLYNWFTMSADGDIDPVGFSDSLVQLELLLTEMMAKTGRHRFGAIGVGQGATILAALAALWPERFAWLVLRGGVWAVLPEELLPVRPMDALPVLAMRNATEGAADWSELANRRANVASIAADDDLEAMRAWIMTRNETVRI